MQEHCTEPWYIVFWNVWISPDFRILPKKKQGLYFVKQQIDIWSYVCPWSYAGDQDAKRLNWKQLLGFLQSDTAKRMRSGSRTRHFRAVKNRL